MSGNMTFPMTGHNNAIAGNNNTKSSTDVGKQALDGSGTCELGVPTETGRLRK